MTQTIQPTQLITRALYQLDTLSDEAKLLLQANTPERSELIGYARRAPEALKAAAVTAAAVQLDTELGGGRDLWAAYIAHNPVRRPSVPRPHYTHKIQRDDTYFQAFDDVRVALNEAKERTGLTVAKLYGHLNAQGKIHIGRTTFVLLSVPSTVEKIRSGQRPAPVSVEVAKELTAVLVAVEGKVEQVATAPASNRVAEIARRNTDLGRPTRVADVARLLGVTHAEARDELLKLPKATVSPTDPDLFFIPR